MKGSAKTSDNTRKKQGGASPFKPRQSCNPAGRPKGARNKLGERFLEDLLHSWEAQGSPVIQTVIDTKPEAYLKVVASLMPKDVNINVNQIGEMSDEQHLERLRKLDATIKPFLPSHGEDGNHAGDGAPTTH
ncbi:hypothetical protein [Brucella pseudogrignonensis]|uniref:hypothetical protein n=1 Tax=Brucella pseudogrignonensis TaxID=419475 RepID=UPI0002BA8402|nr:hypothetical protein [Brucella pseudogrignonensis]EMG51586.1 hypothetical protein WYI_21625 [Ochrobactrum sp. CDB2]MQP42442.1 hypothetical protein [Ochrobactrum sp. MYb237]ANG99398.1 hypothetical protein A8A54_22990 [Brucella pseudogrignonensis]PQZ39247.1 hypothetical protein CQ059_21805 [Brucella pseudogrignonensis]PRA35887.1 hypothetical protein CQ063_22650 [Brucella pseudogrignonensis]